MVQVEILELTGSPEWGRAGDVNIIGGFGSDLAVDPEDASLIWLLTDRGPNVDAGPNRKLFPVPEFTPRVGAFRLDGSRLSLERIVALRDASGAGLHGLPPGDAVARAELALGPDGRALAASGSGVDPEGLAMLHGGGFWTAEEYGPSLLQHDDEGRIVRRVAPGRGAWTLPSSLLARRPNYGFEGLTLLSDGHTLAAVVQGVLETGDERTAAARFVLLDTRTGDVRELLYPLESRRTFPSAVCAAGPGHVLVLEHDALVPGHALRPSWCKRVYRAVLDEGDDGSAARVLRKTLLLDLLALGYPHDKPEGIDLAGPRTLLLVNDDDFGIAAGADGTVVAKRLPMLGGRDRNTVWRITFETDIRHVADEQRRVDEQGADPAKS